MLRSRRSRQRQAPSESAFEALVRDHADAVYRVAYSVVGDRHLAEDVVQETIIKAWQGLDSWRGDGSQRSWVLSIAHNTAVSCLRRVRDTSTDPSQLPDHSTISSAERSAVALDDLDRLRVALDSLDDLSRSIVVMRDLDAMTYQQIAEALDLPLPTVKTRLLRARRQLLRIVEPGVPA